MASTLTKMLTGGSLGFSDSNSSTSSNQNSNFSTSGSTNTQRTLTPYQSAIQAPLFSYISNLMTNPGAAIAPFQVQARNNVNANYNGLADSLRQQFLGSTGGGGSGKFGMALASGNLKRLSQLSDVDNQFAQTAAQLPLQASSIAQALLGMNFGQTTDTSATGSQQTQGTSKTSSSGFSI